MRYLLRRNPGSVRDFEVRRTVYLATVVPPKDPAEIKIEGLGDVTSRGSQPLK